MTRSASKFGNAPYLVPAPLDQKSVCLLLDQVKPPVGNHLFLLSSLVLGFFPLHYIDLQREVVENGGNALEKSVLGVVIIEHPQVIIDSWPEEVILARKQNYAITQR